MNFKMVDCPKCGKKELLGVIYTGTTCNCGMGLIEDTKSNRKDHEKEVIEFAGAFNSTYEEFCGFKKRYEEDWNEKNAFVPFKVVSIIDEKLMEMIANKSCPLGDKNESE